MTNLELAYVEIDGLLYPHIEIDGKTELENLGKYGLLRLNYLREQKPQMYRELLLSGNFAVAAAMHSWTEVKCTPSRLAICRQDDP